MFWMAFGKAVHGMISFLYIFLYNALYYIVVVYGDLLIHNFEFFSTIWKRTTKISVGIVCTLKHHALNELENKNEQDCLKYRNISNE